MSRLFAAVCLLAATTLTVPAAFVSTPEADVQPRPVPSPRRTAPGGSGHPLPLSAPPTVPPVLEAGPTADLIGPAIVGTIRPVVLHGEGSTAGPCTASTYEGHRDGQGSSPKARWVGTGVDDRGRRGLSIHSRVALVFDQQRIRLPQVWWTQSPASPVPDGGRTWRPSPGGSHQRGPVGQPSGEPQGSRRLAEPAEPTVDGRNVTSPRGVVEPPVWQVASASGSGRSCPPLGAVRGRAGGRRSGSGVEGGEHALLARCVASTYGWDPVAEHLNRHTFSGDVFDPDALTVASPDLPMGTVLDVTANGLTVRVTVTDRGPAAWTGRCLDLARGVWRALGLGDVPGLVQVTYQEVPA